MTLMQQEGRQLNELLALAQSQALSYLQGLPDMPISRPTPVQPAVELPEHGIGTPAALSQFQTHFSQALVASSGPRYWGFVTGGTTPAAIAGDWLTAVYDQNPQSITGPGDVSASIELHTLQLYRQLFSLPDNFMGGFVTGATLSNFTALAVARQWAGRQQGHDIARDGVTSGIRILAATPHSSAVKSLAMLGLGSRHITYLRTLTGREAMDVAHLEDVLAQEPNVPTILISSGGTVNTVDYDDMQAIAELRGRYAFWWHVDAAFGGLAALSPSFQDRLAGWDQADSLTIDNHKWLNVPYDSAVYLIKTHHAALQVQTFQNASAPYLGDPLADFSYLNYGPENSRRLRALPVWLTLLAYGREGYRQLVEQNVAQARAFGTLIDQSDFLQLEAPVRLNVVCFSLKPYRTDKEKLTQFQKKLEALGQVFMTPTVYNGVCCLRAAFVNWRTTPDDLNLAMASMQTAWEAVREA
ncbi:aspartate aminotransferase family protein [Fibrisoma montanum]|uniref:Aspartate aminotransferase family protein n=1 Tax=Fibrisoma montanum TaxID=2305895 RepID=A0A418MDK4_9BACT|nr:pyridoxal-dependent decarboxylase [Fibrisoma montanum]RIV24899.1 aspartate aminotransferase family protein [Fibrisoma montanum]